MSKPHLCLLICLPCLFVTRRSSAFLSRQRARHVHPKRPASLAASSGGGEDSGDETTSTYESSGSSSKGIVSSLTAAVNFFMNFPGSDDVATTGNVGNGAPPPATPTQLLEKIRDDYEVNNYLWTGDIHIPAFEAGCRFADPTLSFVGTDRFVSNVRNLRLIVDSLVEGGAGGGCCRSDLLDIRLDEGEGYVQSRWNMVGELNRLPWKPKIDVIGRTKFWYRPTGDGDASGVRVFFYDEEWEITAGRALLQLVTPAGTMSNQPE